MHAFGGAAGPAPILVSGAPAAVGKVVDLAFAAGRHFLLNEAGQVWVANEEGETSKIKFAVHADKTVAKGVAAQAAGDKLFVLGADGLVVAVNVAAKESHDPVPIVKAGLLGKPTSLAINEEGGIVSLDPESGNVFAFSATSKPRLIGADWDGLVAAAADVTNAWVFNCRRRPDGTFIAAIYKLPLAGSTPVKPLYDDLSSPKFAWAGRGKADDHFCVPGDFAVRGNFFYLQSEGRVWRIDPTEGRPELLFYHPAVSVSQMLLAP